jgi:hypothetical protein
MGSPRIKATNSRKLLVSEGMPELPLNAIKWRSTDRRVHAVKPIMTADMLKSWNSKNLCKKVASDFGLI